MDEYILREEKRLCRKYGVKDIDSVLEIQYEILKKANKLKK
jgi:hypothetical protein